MTISRKALDHTLQLLKELDRAVTAPEILATVRTHLAGFGVETIMASLLPDPMALRTFDRRSVLMENVPAEWALRYMRQRYAVHDPIVAQTFSRRTGFGWHDADMPEFSSGHSKRVMGEAAELGLREGFTVPLTTIEGHCGGMSFVGHRLEMAPEHRSMLTLVASYAFGHALVARIEPATSGASLSPREKETLQWAAEGRNDREIGEVMGISEHGVDTHLRAIRIKLKARNRAQAVAEGIRLGIIV